MRKYIILVFVIIFLALVCLCTDVSANEGITYYYRDAIKIADTENIKVMDYEILINTENSTLEESILLSNLTGEELVTEVRLPLESPDLGISISDLSVSVNGLKIKNYPRTENGEYVFKIKINPAEGKRIGLNYRIDSNLRNAKVIKYNFDNLKVLNKGIEKIKFDITFPEEDIPLVTGIYPMHYNIDGNIISIEYYNVPINTLTKNIIIAKDTYNDLLFNRDEKELPDGAYEFLKMAPSYIENGISIDYDSINNNYYFINEQILFKHNLMKEVTSEWTDADGVYRTSTYYEPIIDKLPTAINSLIEYIIHKQIIRDNKNELFNTRDKTDMYSYSNLPSLLYRILVNDLTDNVELKGKNICIEFVETESDKDLYIRRYISEWTDDGPINTGVKDILANERDLLKTKCESLQLGGLRRC